jgi:phage-related protein (TIGR01555 family)
MPKATNLELSLGGQGASQEGESPLVRLDAFANALTGAGNPLLDKGAAWAARSNVARLPQETLLSIWRNSYYAARIVDLPTSDALVQGWQIVDPADKFLPQNPKWEEMADKLDIHGVLHRADAMASALGTAYILPITYDGNNTADELSSPLDLTRLHVLSQFVVLEPRECVPERIWASQSALSDIMQPSAYRIQAHNGMRLAGRWGQALMGNVKIHPSRIIKIVAKPVTTTERLQMTYGEGDSILQCMWEAIARAEGSDLAASILAAEMKQDVVRVPDLKAIGVSDSAGAFRNRMMLIKAGLSMLNMVVLGEGEEYESRASNVQGFKDLSEAARNALVAATGIPEPILFGKATSGLASAPGTEQEAYIRLVEGRQQQRIAPALRRMLQVGAASRAGVFAGNQQFRYFQIKFNPLIRETKKDVAARRLIDAQRDAIYAGMLSSANPDLGSKFAIYVATNRHGADGWQDELPTFDYKEPPASAAPAPTPTGPVPPQLGGPKPAPPGQMPSEGPSGGEGQGAPGVDLQSNNTGKGRFDD